MSTSTVTEPTTVAAPTPPRPSRAMIITGWVLGLLPAPLFILSAVMKFAPPPEIREASEKAGWTGDVMFALGFVELACLTIYLIPQTAVLGAILLTGYLGGAIATHVRAGEPFWIPLLIGVILWLGVYLRDARLRALVPLRKPRY